MRATSSTTAWTSSGPIVATEPTSSPVAGLKDSSVDAAGRASVVAMRSILDSGTVSDRLFDDGQGSGPQGPRPGAPLPVRMRPRSLEELVGQGHVLGEGSALRRAIEEGHPHSAILYGPPGSGKTTLARIAAAGAEGAFEEESAVNAGKAE